MDAVCLPLTQILRDTAGHATHDETPDYCSDALSAAVLLLTWL